MNQFNGLGRITKDLELKTSQSGKSVLNNSIAINRPFKNAQGEREADFINFVAFGKTAEIIAQYHKKGDMIGLTGRMQSRSYENNSGQRVFVTELVVNEMHFTGGNDNQQNNQTQRNQSQNNVPDYYQGQIGQPQNRAQNPNIQNNIDDGMLPFD